MSKFPSESRVQICGLNAHDCGYCKNEKKGKKNTSVSYGFLSETMTVEDYQSIMLLGWRRSGKYFYKPVMNRTCCPQYPIRLRVNEHKLSKSQKKVLKNVEKYLAALTDDVTNSSEDGLRLSSEFTFPAASTTADSPVSPNSGGTPKITIEMDAATCTDEKFALYCQYQIDVHKDKPEELTEKGFKRFLCDSPLKDTNKSARPDPTYKYGTFHQLYRLNGKLIAVGVVDLLPLGLSSVYVFYDNSLKQLALGKYTALKEIEFCRTHHFAFYFMGFYIHTCEKMRYKGEYKPSDLLCPTTFQWYPLHPHCSDILERFNFSPFEPALAARRALVQADVGGTPGAGAADADADAEADTAGETAAMGAEESEGTAEPGSAAGAKKAGQSGQSTTEPTSSATGNNNASAVPVPQSDSQSKATVGTAAPKSAKDSKASGADKAGSGDSKGPTPSNESGGEVESDSEDESQGSEEGEGAEDPVAAVVEDVNLKLLDEFAPLFGPRPAATAASTNASASTAAVKKGTTTTTATTGTTGITASGPSRILTLFQMVKTVPLDVGVGVPISVTQLRPEGIKQLSPFLEEWISYVGPEVGATIAVSLV